MFALIGLGLWDLGDLPLKALATLKECDEVYAERYTNWRGEKADEEMKELEEKINKKITVLSREEVEDGKKLIENAKEKNVALLVPGDPLVATTHISLLLEARKRKIKTQVIHASSIFTAAAGEAGLQIYKFGKTVTLAKWHKGYEPMTAYDVVEGNLACGLHTLLLIDIDEGKPLEAREIFELLEKMEAKAKRKIFAAARELVVLSRVGSEEQKINYGKTEKLSKKKLGKPPFVLIVPGELHFMEKEVLDSL